MSFEYGIPGFGITVLVANVAVVDVEEDPLVKEKEIYKIYLISNEINSK